jgi:threonine dehydratase
MYSAISSSDLSETHKLIAPFIHKTPIITSQILNTMTQSDLYFKCECLQKTGSFKIRGATNAVLSLSEKERNAGVVTHSSGNFAQALAQAASKQNIKSWIVMPKNAPSAKRAATQGYGGEIVECEPTVKDRETTAAKIVEQYDATFIHPYNQYPVIRGQATAAMEFIADIKDLDIMIAPVGGGGLLSGTALACKYFSPETKVFAAEPEGADDAFKSFHSNTLIPQTNPQTIADGLRTSLGDLTFPIIKSLVTDILTVSEQEIMDAMKLFWSRTKLIIEPSAAVAFAAVIKNQTIFSEKKVGIILSGGNVDFDSINL